VGCRVETDPVHGLAVVRGEGEIGVEDVFSAIQRVWVEPAYVERPRVLWDLRNASMDRLRSPEIREIVGRERKGRPDSRRARMAFVVSTDVGYGMARMVATLIEREPIDVRIFRDDEQAAWRWLAGPDGSDAARE
jgi:hypothetical protein